MNSLRQPRFTTIHNPERLKFVVTISWYGILLLAPFDVVASSAINDRKKFQFLSNSDKILDKRQDDLGGQNITYLSNQKKKSSTINQQNYLIAIQIPTDLANNSLFCREP